MKARSLKYFVLMAMAAIFVLGAIPSFAQSYDAAADFSATRNPNGVWSYGWSETLWSGFNLYTWRLFRFDGLDTWSDPKLGIDPEVLHNGTDRVIDTGFGIWEPGRLALHPGPSNQYSHVLWTAPGDGTYSIEAVFIGLDYAGGTTTDVFVIHNDYVLLGQLIRRFGATASLKTTVSVLRGDIIDFAAGVGTGGYVSDSTGLYAFITRVPE